MLHLGGDVDELLAAGGVHRQALDHWGPFGRRVQNGYVRSYALTMVLGVLLVGVVLILGLGA